jgi:hypothetical protein
MLLVMSGVGHSTAPPFAVLTIRSPVKFLMTNRGLERDTTDFH